MSARRDTGPLPGWLEPTGFTKRTDPRVEIYVGEPELRGGKRFKTAHRVIVSRLPYQPGFVEIASERQDDPESPWKVAGRMTVSEADLRAIVAVLEETARG